VIGATEGGGVTRHFELMPDRSALAVLARSNVGPITFTALGLEGFIDVTVAGTSVCLDPPPAGELEFRLDQLTSGNPFYDGELQRRVGSRRFPKVVAHVRGITLLESERYRLEGDLNVHDVTRPVSGMVTVTFPSPTVIRVTGDQVFDIRDFNVSIPEVLMFQILPDVKTVLRLDAQEAVP
jgi:YceI-like domain